MKDQLVRAMTKDGFVNAVAVTTTGIVERARQIHKTLPTATAALGRLLTAASMMGNMQKVDDGSITLQLKGGGPLGRRRQRPRLGRKPTDLHAGEGPRQA